MMKISQEGVPWKTIHYCCHMLYVDELLQVVRVPGEAGYGERDAPDTSDPSMYMSSNQKPLSDRIITHNSVKRRKKE